MVPDMRRNVQNWFLCGIVFGFAIGLVWLTVWAAHAAVLASADFRAYPVFITAIVIGGACYLFKREGHPMRRATSTYCFISRERKARIENLATPAGVFATERKRIIGRG